ncbi:MAG: L-alanine exporter AlaE [Candidatus Nitrosocaldus sp.]
MAKEYRRRYIIDSVASIVFWVPLYIIFNLFVLRLELWQVLALAGFSAVVNFVFGGLFGRFLDAWRRLLKVSEQE